jgi:hypothetical protein
MMLLLVIGTYLLARGDTNQQKKIQSEPRRCAISVLVDNAPSVMVIVPCVDRQELTSLLSNFLSKQNDEMKQKLSMVLSSAKVITVTVTTEERPTER